MPSTKDLSKLIDTSKPVLVTGATGYVAGVLIDALLDKGLTVHATVRDPTQTDRLQYLQDAADKKSRGGSIKFFAADLMNAGSFDEAAQGCSIIFHTASPFALSVEDPDRDLIFPAVEGTKNVLAAASKAKTVRRVVMTSSVVAIYGHAADMEDTPEKKFTEDIWNRSSSRTDSPYSLSKTLAEQAAWVIAGSQLQWKLVVVNPVFVMGPGLKVHPSSESYKFLIDLKDMASAGAPPVPIGVVDVRDVADTHIAAAYVENAAGRHICCGHNSSVLGMCQALTEKYPATKYPIPSSTLRLPKTLMWLVGPYVAPLSRTFISKNFGLTLNFDNTKSKNELGIEYLPLTQTMQDMYQQLLDAKLIEPKV